ncbi:MAG: amino-acid N-acetyltransferase [Burkholderiaceae bacterium]
MPDAAANPTGLDTHFVNWLRTVAPYIHAFRGQTFVVGVPGELIADGLLTTLVNDLSLLNALGIRLVLVYGSRPQVVEQLRLRQLEDLYHGSLRITDAAVLECVKEAAGELRLDFEAAFSQGLPNTPMQNSTVRVISGNFVTARPQGVIGGIDLQFTGTVRKIDTRAIRFALDGGAIVLVSPLGFSPTGEAFNLTMEDVSSAIAVALDADKLVYLIERPGVTDEDGQVISELSELDAAQAIDAGTLDDDTAFYLRYALKACRSGVSRAHLVPYLVDGGLLLELFRHDGLGTMLVEETLEALREARADDIGGILAIIRPMEEDGTLVKRDHALIERDIDRYSVIEHDGVIFGCAALYHQPGEGIGEMACLAVNPGVQGQGDGDRLLRHIEHRARRAGLNQLYVLTTRTMHWFLKRGFRVATPAELPEHRRATYDENRRSQVLIKSL